MIKEKRLNNKIIYFIIFIIVIILLALLVKANLTLKDEFENSDTIIFLGNEGIAPILYNEKGRAKGVAVDIAKALGKKTGHKIEVRGVDWDEAQNMLLLEEADALLQINPNPEREKIYDFSDELLESEFSIFIKSGNISIKKVDDLRNKTVGIESGGYPYTLLENYDGINIEIITDWQKGFQDVASGKLDAIVVDRWIGEYELAESRVKGIQIIDQPIEFQYSRIAVKKGNKELLSLINTGLKEINEDGTMAEILSKWKEKRVIYLTEERLRSTFLYSIIIVLGLILLISLYWINKLSKLSKKLESDVKQRTQELHNSNKLLRKANAELEKISMSDGLTTIPNRRCFDVVFQKTWDISLKEGKPLAIIMIDIDNFKLFNDTYGHLAGDQCLKSVAEGIKSIIKRKGDLVARFGGEEFVVMLSNNTEDGAAMVAEDMRMKIESLQIKNQKVDSVITISLGVAATIPRDDMCPYDLINWADKALYQGKEEGRNKVTRFRSLYNNF